MDPKIVGSGPTGGVIFFGLKPLFQYFPRTHFCMKLDTDTDAQLLFQMSVLQSKVPSLYDFAVALLQPWSLVMKNNNFNLEKDLHLCSSF